MYKTCIQSKATKIIKISANIHSPNSFMTQIHFKPGSKRNEKRDISSSVADELLNRMSNFPSVTKLTHEC